MTTQPASIVRIGGFRPTRHPLTSNFGFAPVARPSDAWPTNDNGKPLFFVCQFNLVEPPYVPPILDDIAIIQFFLDNDARENGRENGHGWLIRTYPDFDQLTPLAVPPGATFPRGFELRWEKVIDCATTSDPIRFEGEPPDFADIGDNVIRTKIGGFGSYFQSEPWWTPYPQAPYPGYKPVPASPQFCFQIVPDERLEKMQFYTAEMYFARGTAPGYENCWFLDTQCD